MSELIHILGGDLNEAYWRWCWVTNPSGLANPYTTKLFFNFLTGDLGGIPLNDDYKNAKWIVDHEQKRRIDLLLGPNYVAIINAYQAKNR